MFDSVVFPAPFSPSSAWTSPAAASKSTSSLATTAGKRLVIPRRATAGGGGEACTSPPGLSALGATDHTFDEPVHRVQVLDRHALPLLQAQLALLVVERACELVELAAHDRRLLRRDRALRLRGDLRPVGREPDHPVLDASVVEAALPAAVHRGLDAPEVVRPPVVDRRGQPLLRRERVRVGVVADPRDVLRLRVLAGRRTVDVLSENVGAGYHEALRGLLLLREIEPGVCPDQTNLRAWVRRLRAERERIRVADDLRDRKRHDVAEHALLARRTGCHPRQVDPVLAGAEVLGEVLRLSRSRRLLELHVGMLLRFGDHAALEAERRREDDLVAVADEALDHLARLRSFRHELLERRLHLRAELLLHVQAALVVRLRPPVVVVWADIDPRRLERRLLPRGAGRHAERENERGGEDERQREGEPPSLHGLLSPVIRAGPTARLYYRRLLMPRSELLRRR